jgi:putative aldouronate transport system substrate-binding protein
MNKKLFSTVTAGAMVCVMLAGCGKRDGMESNTQGLAKGEVSYPVQTEQTLSYWVGLNGNVSQIASSVNDLPFTEEEFKRTGIKINYIHPAVGQDQEKFNLLLASGDLPDIVVNYWYNINGGPDKAIQNGYIARLNDLMDYAPNFAKLLEDNPEIDRMVQTDSGNYYVFPALKPDDMQTVYAGMAMRADWLRELNLPIPETIDDWHTALTAFKEAKGADAVLSYSVNSLKNSGAFTGAYGVKGDFYLDNGRVRFGPAEPGYKQYIELFRKWFSEGLIDRNVASNDTKTFDAKILNGNTGAMFCLVGSGIGKWLTAAGAAGDKNFDLVAVPYPVLNRGERPMFGAKDNTFSTSAAHAAISAKSPNKELAARFLDYAFSKEGNLFYNFGTEGVSYDLADGEPMLNDNILKNPDGLSISLALTKYTHAGYEGPFPADVRVFKQNYTMEQQFNALDVWKETDARKHIMPQINRNSEDNEEYKNIMNEATTFVDEKSLQFIMSVIPMSEYDNFVSQLKAMNIDRAIEINQAAVDKYFSRGQ